jgi:hypothetical protein
MIGPFAYIAPFRDQTYYLDSELQAELYDVGMLNFRDKGRSEKSRMPLDPSARLAQFSVKVDQIDLDMIDRKGWNAPTIAANTLIPPFLLGRGADGVAEMLRSELIDKLASGMSAQIDKRAKTILDDDSVAYCKLVGIRSYYDEIVYPSEHSPDEFLVQGLVVPTRLDIRRPAQDRATAIEAGYVPPGSVSRDEFEVSVAGIDMKTEETRILEACAVRGQLRPAEAKFPAVEDVLKQAFARGNTPRSAYFDEGTNATVLNWRFPLPASIDSQAEPTVRITVNAATANRSYTFALPGARGPKTMLKAKLPTPEAYAIIFKDDLSEPEGVGKGKVDALEGAKPEDKPAGTPKEGAK